MKKLGRGTVAGCVACGVLGLVSACSDDVQVPFYVGVAGSTPIFTAGQAPGGSGGAGGTAPSGGSPTGMGGSLVLGGSGETPRGGEGGAEVGGAGGEGTAAAAGQGDGGATGGDAGAQHGGEGGEGGEGGAPSPVDPKCDFTEVESDGNITTGLAITAKVKTLCGRADPGHFDAGEGLLDRDGFDLTLAGEADLLVRLEMPNRTALSRVEVWLNGGKWLVRGDQTVFRVHLYDAGKYTLVLRAYSAADLAEALPYTLSIGTDDVNARCVKAPTATHTEAADGTGSTGNDVFQFSSGYVASLTAADDAPEATNVTLGAAGTRYRLDGTSAAVTATGPFYDADSYTFRSGTAAQQLTVRADWATQSDLDLFLFAAGAPPDLAWGTTRSKQSGEYFTFMLEPNTDYQVYAAAYDGTRPFDYSLTLCTESFDIRGQ